MGVLCIVKLGCVHREDSMPIHCNILVTGPVGVGIGTVVKATARQLNMHLIQVTRISLVCAVMPG
jgi:selenophosphate synthase